MLSSLVEREIIVSIWNQTPRWRSEEGFVIELWQGEGRDNDFDGHVDVMAWLAVRGLQTLH